MNRLKLSAAILVAGLSLTAHAKTIIGGTDPKPPMSTHAVMDPLSAIQIALTVLGL